MVSLVTVPIGQIVLAYCFGILRWSAQVSTVMAAAVSTVPAYYLSRAWVWRRRGRSSLTREVMPFWGLTLTALALSTWTVGIAETRVRDLSSSWTVRTTVVMAVVLASYGVVWIAKYLLLDRLLFREGSNDGGDPVDKATPS